MYPRKQIIENQKKFRKEITDAIKAEFKETKKELASITTQDKSIKAEKEKLEVKLKKIKIANEIEKLFITEKNLYPNYYAWWDDINSQLNKYKYKDK